MTSLKPSQLNWEQIHSEAGIFDEACWRACNSYCCNFEKIIKNYSYLRKTNNIPLFPGEYQYFADIKALQQGFEHSHQRISFRINETLFAVDTVDCNLNGRCTYHRYRPLICKMYPLFPLTDIFGTLTGFELLAPVDVFWEAMAQGTGHNEFPCTIKSLNIKSMNSLIVLCGQLLKNPLTIFFIKLAHIYKKEFQRYISAHHPELFDKGYETFFTGYENILLFENQPIFSAIEAKAKELYGRMDDNWNPSWTNQ